jgi:flagellar basal-body rod protein FlgC
MDNSPIFAISAAGMALERARVEAAALNLANAHSTAAVGQPGFNPVRVVAHSGATQSFAALVDGETGLAALKPEYQIETTNAPARLVHEPGHPLADAKGFVSYPGVDQATEMMSLMTATRAYEANVAAMNTARTLALKALDIGGNQ